MELNIVVCAVEIVGFEMKDKINKLPRKYLNIKLERDLIFSVKEFTGTDIKQEVKDNFGADLNSEINEDRLKKLESAIVSDKLKFKKQKILKLNTYNFNRK